MLLVNELGYFLPRDSLVVIGHDIIFLDYADCTSMNPPTTSLVKITFHKKSFPSNDPKLQISQNGEISK